MNIVMRACIAVLALTVLLGRAEAYDDINDAATQQQILAGIDSLYSMNIDAAEAIFKQIERNNPKNPTGNYFRSQIHLWQYIFNDSLPGYDRFLQQAQLTIDKAEDWIDEHPNKSNFAKTLQGLTFGFRAMSGIKAENFASAAIDVRESYRSLTAALRENNRQYEAYLGIGLFNFMLGSIPPAAQAVVQSVGFEGDREKGLKQLQLAAQRATYAKYDAQFCLGLMHIYYKKDYGAGIPLLKSLIERYPNNVPLLYSMGNIEAQLKKMNFAQRYFNRVINSNIPGFKTFRVYSYYRKGEVLFRENNWRESNIAMQEFLKNSFEASFRPAALIRLGQTYAFLDRSEKAKQAFEVCLDRTAVTPEDRWAHRKAKEYLATPINDTEQQVVAACNLAESRQFEQAITSLQNVLNLSLTTDQQALCRYYLGEALRLTGKLDESIEQFRRVVRLDPKQENWLSPWSMYRISLCLRSQGKSRQAHVMAQQAKVFTGYDFEEWLYFELDRDLSKID